MGDFNVAHVCLYDIISLHKLYCILQITKFLLEFLGKFLHLLFKALHLILKRTCKTFYSGTKLCSKPAEILTEFLALATSSLLGFLCRRSRATNLYAKPLYKPA